jgi:hypothetical protein
MTSRRSRYARRERDTDYMLACKLLPCAFAEVSTCGGPVEADHAGRRALGRKADDTTVIPACSLHHRQRTDFSGPFRVWTRERMREHLRRAIEETQAQLAHLL